MKISIIGTGYVGLVSGTCFAEMGNDVICADINSEKVEQLKNGIIPIYEPTLEELVKRNYKEERLFFTSDIKEAIETSLIIFIAVDTPSQEDGSPNLKRVESVARDIGKYINSYKIVVNKSTVPVGTADFVKSIILEEMEKREENIEFDMVSNPEFLKEGTAIEDFMKPDRVVIGTDNVRTAEIMKELYSPFVRNDNPIITMDIKSAEMTKYAANAFLATKISFINEIANLCEALGADVANVKKGMASDSRIGGQFLFPGLGYGGSCLPKDVKIINNSAKESDYKATIFETVNKINDRQKTIIVDKIFKYFKNKKDLTIGIWGLSFKPQTDDIREAPSIIIIKKLIENGFKINAYDPEAIENVKKLLGENENIKYFENMYDALDGVDAMLLVTEWMQFRRPDFEKMKKLMKNPLIFDGRNQYEPTNMRKIGFSYYCIGRQSV
ncbi:MAG: UDP-glucose/GDP-mannose dehydrogenase family protein [Candidatus Sericytochromatia bacterium]